MRAIWLSLFVVGCGGHSPSLEPSSVEVFTTVLDRRCETVRVGSVQGVMGTYTADYLYHCRTFADEQERWEDLLPPFLGATLKYKVRRGSLINHQIGYAQGTVEFTLDLDYPGTLMTLEWTQEVHLRRDNGVWKEYGGGTCP